MLKKKYQKSNIKKVSCIPINTNQIIFFAVVFCLCSFIGIYLVYVQQQDILQLKNTIIYLEKALSEQSLELDRLIKESEFPQENNQKKDPFSPIPWTDKSKEAHDYFLVAVIGTFVSRGVYLLLSQIGKFFF